MTKNQLKKKPSEIIEEWTEMWLVWMKNNSVVRDETKSYKERRLAAEECERLIDKEYVLVEQFDQFFPNEQTGHRDADKTSFQPLEPPLRPEPWQ